MVTFQTYEVKGVTWGTPSFILVIGQIFGEDGYSLKASSSVAMFCLPSAPNISILGLILFTVHIHPCSCNQSERSIISLVC